MKQHNQLGLHRIDVPLQLERKTKGLKDDDDRIAYTTLHHVLYLVLPLYCMHVNRAPLAKCTPKLPPTAPAPATTMMTSNSQLRKPTSRLLVPQNYLNFPNKPIDLDNKTFSTLIYSWSLSSMSARTHSPSTEAPLSNITITLKQQKINTEDNNPSNHKQNFE